MREEIKCPACGRVVGYIQIQITQLKVDNRKITKEDSSFSFKTTIHCPEGHLLTLQVTSQRPPTFVLAT
jgi:hypothetical protein